jgi:DNA repair exonuclease SbcCD ATPase subunit
LQLSHEASRALRLDEDLAKCSEDLRNEKLNLQNLESTLTAAHQQVRDKDLEARELQATLETLSSQSDGFKMHGTKLQQEKKNLESRVRELEAQLQRLNPPSVHSARKRARPKRSSSPSDFVVTSLENQLEESKNLLSKKETDLRLSNEKLASLQADLLNIDNEKIAMEKQLKTQLNEVQESLEETEEELQFLKGQQGYGGSDSREADLVRRVEEDQAKIEALEMLLRDDRELNSTKEALKKAELRLRMEAQKANQSETRLIEAVREKEEALDELDDARRRMDELAGLVHDKEAEIAVLNESQR